MAAGAGKVSRGGGGGGGGGKGGWTRCGVGALSPRSPSAERSESFLPRWALPERVPPARGVEAAADPARGLQASPPASGPASLPHLLLRRGCRPCDATLARATLSGGGREPERPSANFPPPRPRSLPGGRASPGPSRPATPLPRPARGDALQVPGRPDWAAAGAPAGACRGRRRPPSPPPPPRRLVPARGPRATSRAASAPQGRCRRCGRRSSPARPAEPAALRTRGLPRRLSARPARTLPAAARRARPSMLQCCHVSATEGGTRPPSQPQPQPQNWCVTHRLGHLQSPNCLPGLLRAAAVRCRCLPGQKMD
ncbi:basic proline-rich protein-like [Sorex fumeus]|uniref:basic proline-rich protein-like n=1 Tax=Sorex fumeus TaxID=62283 RepID=UPI0024AD3C0D|nr:basic proline-rich protein-like [Sorex fumeus]